MDLQQQAAALRAEMSTLREKLAPIQKKLDEIEAQSKQTALARMEEIRNTILSLATEAEECASRAGMVFYKDSFIEGTMRGMNGGYWDNEHYWQSSSINC